MLGIFKKRVVHAVPSRIPKVGERWVLPMADPWAKKSMAVRILAIKDDWVKYSYGFCQGSNTRPILDFLLVYVYIDSPAGTKGERP